MRESGFWSERLLAGILVLALAAAAGCGGSSSSSGGGGGTTAAQTSSGSSSQASKAPAWAQSFCTYTQTWETSLKKARTALGNPAHLTQDRATAARDDAKAATILFTQQLAALGPPPSPGSAQSAQELKTLGGRIRNTAQNLQGSWSIPAGNSAALLQKIAILRGTLVTMVNQLNQAFSFVKQLDPSDQLRQAMTTNPTCQAVFGKG